MRTEATLAMPECVRFYRSTAPCADAARADDDALLLRAVEHYVGEMGLPETDIESLGVEGLGRLKHPDAPKWQAAFVRSCARLGLVLREASLLFCEQTVAHSDEEFFPDKVFASYVVSTGGEPYLLRLGNPEEGPCTEHMLRAGDFFVFDPAVIHQAIPLQLAPGSRVDEPLLVLLQEDVDYTPHGDKLALFKRFAPCANA